MHNEEIFVYLPEVQDTQKQTVVRKTGKEYVIVCWEIEVDQQVIHIYPSMKCSILVFEDGIN